MDPSSTELGRMLLEEIAPVIMVLRTPLVEEACLKNGLSFIEMLTPFCEFNNIDVPVRTSSDQPYRLQKFKLRLFYASDVREPSPEVSSERLRQVVLDAAKNLTYPSDDAPEIEDVLTASLPEIVPSWFQIFNKELYRTLSFSDQEAFDHPVACLLVVSSMDELPINRFIDLFNTNQLPSLLNDGVMDPKILKHYLLVHDNQDDNSENAAQILSEMISTFGPNVCRLLSINSSVDGCTNDEDSMWFIHSNGSSANRQLGCFFSSDDLNEIKSFMRDLTSKHVIPHMEQKVRILNQQVSATRKGFRNQLKNLWWRKGKEDMPNLPNTPMYTFSSIESQIRVLGDYAFMLRDYELASSNYRLLSTDYKLDKAWKHYAGVQEMLGLTYFMLDQSKKEAEYCMENAFSTYLKLGSLGLQNAARSGIWWAEMLKARDNLKDAAGVYARISCGVFLQEPLLSAVMLEQASYCYLFSKPIMLRKYGFNLLLAGDIYHNCDQIKHAIRTYRDALSLYNGSKWSCVKEHVHFQIGKWYTSIGMFDVAVAHMLEALVCIYQTKSTQELFLKDFLDIVQKTGRTFEVLKFSLPVINDASLRVIFEDHRTYASPAAVNVAETTWELLEEDLVQSGSSIKPNWMESQSENFVKKFNDSLFCIAREEIQVYVEFQNPLQTPLSIFNVSLSCELTPQSYGTEQGAAEFTISGLNKDFFVLSQADFVLDGGEISSVRLTVTPVMEGILKIIGIKWKLSSHVVGFHDLSLGLNRRKAFMERRKSKISEIDNLHFIVVKSLPKLEGFVHHLPAKAYMGDTRAVVLELKNLSQYSVVNMRMKVGDPRFLGVAHQDVVDLDFPACLEKRDNTKLNHARDTEAIRGSVFQFPEDTIIRDGKPLLCPLWLQAAVPGNMALYIIIYYELKDLANPISYRTLRMHFSLEVLPSLDMSFHVNSSLTMLDEHIVRMDVINKACSESFNIHQLSLVGLWELSLLQPASPFLPLQILTPGQTVSCFFRLKPCGNSESSIQEESDICFSPSTEQIYHVSRLPLASFRQDQHTADFVLVFWPADNNVKSINHHSPPVFCHHMSRCNVIPVGSSIRWVMLGQHVASHNFNVCPCEVKLKMVVYNASNAVISVRVSMLDPFGRNREAADSDGLHSGWHDPTQEMEIGRVRGSISVEASPPFIWSGLSSRTLELDPLVSIEIPLEVTLFSPGTYDLSDYVVHWSFMPSTRARDDRQSSGSYLGHPYYLTAVQSL